MQDDIMILLGDSDALEVVIETTWSSGCVNIIQTTRMENATWQTGFVSWGAGREWGSWRWSGSWGFM